MAAISAPATLSEFQDDFQESLKEATGVVALDTLVGRYLNKGLHDMHRERWWWAERRANLLLHDDYTTGTVSVALATRTTVTGVGTLWNTAVTGMGFNNARAGGKMTFAGSNEVYTVSSVTNDTEIVLADRFIGDAALTAVTYRYFEDEYVLASDFDPELGLVDARHFDERRTIQLKGAQEFYLQFPRNSQVGRPKYATIVELGPSGSVALRPRVIFAPPPDQQEIIPYRYYTINLAVSSAGVGAENLSATTDEPIVPLRWRHGIVLKAMELWVRERERNPELATGIGQEYAALMLRARQAHSQTEDRPRFMPRDLYNRRARRPWGWRATGRYSTDDRFDRIED